MIPTVIWYTLFYHFVFRISASFHVLFEFVYTYSTFVCVCVHVYITLGVVCVGGGGGGYSRNQTDEKL